MLKEGVHSAGGMLTDQTPDCTTTVGYSRGCRSEEFKWQKNNFQKSFTKKGLQNRSNNSLNDASQASTIFSLKMASEKSYKLTLSFFTWVVSGLQQFLKLHGHRDTDLQEQTESTEKWLLQLMTQNN